MRGAVGGESGQAIIDPEARGEEALGREAFRRDKGPAKVREGTPRVEVVCTCTGADCAWEGDGPSLLARVDPCPLSTGFSFDASLAPNAEKSIPDKVPSEIFGCSSLSIGGRSSSVAAYLSLPAPLVGEVPLELL